MKKIKNIFFLIIIILAVFFAFKKTIFQYFYTSRNIIKDFNYKRDFTAVERLFKDNWFILLTDESFKTYSVDYMLKNKSSCQKIPKNDLILKVLYIDNKTVGFTAFYKKSNFTWQFLFLVIDKEYQGKGYGKLLLKYAVDEMFKAGALKIDLNTRIVNYAAQSLYEKFGFVKDQYLGDGRYVTYYLNKKSYVK